MDFPALRILPFLQTMDSSACRRVHVGRNGLARTESVLLRPGWLVYGQHAGLQPALFAGGASRAGRDQRS